MTIPKDQQPQDWLEPCCRKLVQAYDWGRLNRDELIDAILVSHRAALGMEIPGALSIIDIKIGAQIKKDRSESEDKKR